MGFFLLAIGVINVTGCLIALGQVRAKGTWVVCGQLFTYLNGPQCCLKGLLALAEIVLNSSKTANNAFKDGLIFFEGLKIGLPILT